MNNIIYHRGPDDDGLYTHNDKVIFGMRRLSIIDVKHGKQPITNADGSLVIVFNGEIYNFRELRSELVNEGEVFKTFSDTEVVLRMYERKGESFISQLNGMFAFAIHDVKRKKVLIARDRFGEKPLYYTNNGNECIWASELKSIISLRPALKQILTSSVELFLSLSYIPAPHTIYKDIYKLEPGCTMILDTDTLGVSINRYWNIEPLHELYDGDYNGAKKKLHDLVFDSVEKRMIADVPVGVFLSGGVDSTIVASIMAKKSATKIKTFTVGYDNARYDESDRARTVAKHVGSEHYECMLAYDEMIGDIDKVILNYDEPFADSSSLPTYFISRKTAAFVKVALTGDGGDEVFAGYNKYLLHTYGEVYQKWVPRFVSKLMIEPSLSLIAGGNTDTKSWLTKMQKLFVSIGSDAVSNHLNIIRLGFRSSELGKLLNGVNITDKVDEALRKILKEPLPSILTTSLKKAQYIDTKISLEGDLLVKVDRASMLTSLECRAPFLDHRLIEFSYILPDNFLLKGKNKKRLLKDTFEYLLPDNFFNAPKSGFEIPIGAWLRNEIKNELELTLTEDSLARHSFFNWSYVRELINAHMTSQEDNSSRLWTLFCFQKWYNANF